MTITAEAPRGGVAEYLGDTSYTFKLRNREIERFEDKHRGIFDLWEGFFERGKKPNSKEIRDILALGLVGGGMKDHEADEVIAKAGLSRENSRGAHFREDFPDAGPMDQSYFTVATDGDSGIEVSREAVKFTIVKPGESLLGADEAETLVGAAQ